MEKTAGPRLTGRAGCLCKIGHGSLGWAAVLFAFQDQRGGRVPLAGGCGNLSGEGAFPRGIVPGRWCGGSAVRAMDHVLSAETAKR